MGKNPLAPYQPWPENVQDLKGVDGWLNLYQAARMARFSPQSPEVTGFLCQCESMMCKATRRDKARPRTQNLHRASDTSDVFRLDREEPFGHILELQGQF